MAMNSINQQRFFDWLRTRPPIVRELLLKYPPRTKFNIHGKVMHCIGANEDGGLILTEIDPKQDYEKALAARRPVCACCLDKLESLKV